MAQLKEISHDLRVVIIGAGMAGILSAIKLREAGYTDFTIYEKAHRVGGTWRENTYPGIACDVPAHLYTYSFEPNPNWTQTFAPGDEIEAYFEGVARKYGVMESIRFGEEIKSCEFVDGRWQLLTAKGERDTADILIAATGVLHHPNIPDIPGLDTFAGARFHSARWDHSVALDGRRVGVIGTGSTAIQITSALAPRVGKFELFQRTAQWIMPIENARYSEAERANFNRDPALMAALREQLHEMMIGGIANAVIKADSPEMQMIEKACLDNLENGVKDPVLREKLRPNYRAACKRLIFSTDFYDAIQLPNAELVTEAIEAVEPKGIRTRDGRLHELDVLVLATGFAADRFVRPARVIGRDGIDLDTVWADRPFAYLSISVPNFPNFFMLNGPNGPVGNFSLIQIAEFQLGYIMQLLDQIRAGKCQQISASQAATAKFDEARIDAAKGSIWSTGCKSWYLDKHGVPASWPWAYSRFAEVMATPELDAYDLVS